LEKVYSFSVDSVFPHRNESILPVEMVDPVWSLKCYLEREFPEGGGEGRVTCTILTFQKAKKLQAAELCIPTREDSRIYC